MNKRKLLLFFVLLVQLLSRETAAQDTTLVDAKDVIFERVEIEAAFPGGDAAWRSFLEKNLDGDVPVRKKAPAGVYTVIIQFVVDKEGKISEIIPLTSHGYGMEEEVIRILRKAPRWKPAIQDGRMVRAYRKQPVTFWIEEEKKKKKNKD